VGNVIKKRRKKMRKHKKRKLLRRARHKRKRWSLPAIAAIHPKTLWVRAFPRIRRKRSDTCVPRLAAVGTGGSYPSRSILDTVRCLTRPRHSTDFGFRVRLVFVRRLAATMSIVLIFLSLPI